MASTTRLELRPVPRASPGVAPAHALDAVERYRLIARAKALAWLSLGWMTVEGVVAVTAAALSGSVALLGFGLDSVIEGLASTIAIWRFSGRRRLSDQAERRAERLVALTFFLLAPFIFQDAIRTVAGSEHPATSWPGIVLSISSIVVMPLLAKSKQRLGDRLGSGAVAGEGTQNMLCAYLAVGVLAGLALNAAFGLWWADPAVALALAAPAVHEGRQSWRGEGCCSVTPEQPAENRPDDCCD